MHRVSLSRRRPMAAVFCLSWPRIGRCEHRLARDEEESRNISVKIRLHRLVLETEDRLEVGCDWTGKSSKTRAFLGCKHSIILVAPRCNRSSIIHTGEPGDADATMIADVTAVVKS
ncbi:hypothetical protein GGS23DRAFT_131188 [Durotheca rogersii]|uniref:uncharacterized protein n=1 Tax=Durotheca rogersii TaxID=419775 RepID=UPI002220753E|nr:uncharacterized protein GGS23DRAFT_131188 [Durotheca rogersii]KAI5861785.1 hypothetical protein GGS23DRAFT_131188 [Durotheca rogersii]